LDVGVFKAKVPQLQTQEHMAQARQPACEQRREQEPSASEDKPVALQPHLSSTRREPERQFLSCFTVTSCMIGNRQQSVLNVLS
jgi:hypothetical protein